MPDISGVDLTRAVRQWFDSRQLPIIMVTTENEGQDSAAAKAAGVNAVLHKPFDQGQLVAAIEAHLPAGGPVFN
jgi:CheY-like chemotaxis protein